MFRTPPRGTHRAPGRAVVDFRALTAPVSRSVGGAVALGAVTASVAIVGVGTANAQVSASPQPRAVSAPAASWAIAPLASSSQPTLRQGARSSAVSTLQKLLREHGATVAVDGSFGPATYRAVVAFQKSAGLAADGVVGPKTWAALNGSAGGSNSGGSNSGGSSSGSSSDVKGAAIVATAKAQVGTKYLWGGSTPSGFDCSGLTSYAYKQNGITIPRTARTQALGGKIISKSEARPGDLVAFTEGNYNHIGIYAGDGKLIDASGSQGKVVYRSIWNAPHVFVTYR